MNVAIVSRLSALGLVLGACATRGPAPVAIPNPANSAATAPKVAAAPLPALTPEEADLADRLRKTVTHLSVEVGERNIAQSWNLATATDDLAIALEKMGYSVRRQGIVVGDAVVQNLEVSVPGGTHGKQTVVVGAHFDTREGTPGADDDASGVAAVMELARLFRERKLDRSIRFALFVNGEEPHLRTDHMGSLVYAKDLAGQGLDLVGMLSLDGVGAFSAVAGSQKNPDGASTQFPDRGDFVAVVADESSRTFYDQVVASLSKHATLPVVGGLVGKDHALVASSDPWSFWAIGMPAVLITDTAAYRYPQYHQKTDLPAALDFERMARVVAGLDRALVEVAVGRDE